MKDRYLKRGVSADKAEVHEAIKSLDKGLYDKAFCKILPDIGGEPDIVNIMHADTAGTKTSLAYLQWRESKDATIWKGIAQDAIVMNVDDMACVGVTDNILLSSTIGRNKHLITGEVISTIINAAVAFVDQMRSFDIGIKLAGGETADVGDIVRTIDVGYTTFARLPHAQLIVNNIRPGQIIVGFASDGQATYEQEYNSGIGSNGLTSARHDLLHKHYAHTYPESLSPESPDDVIYTGKYRLSDRITHNGKEYLVSQLLLSPTRTYLPLIREFQLQRIPMHGLIHCTGGGQSKVKHFLDKDVDVIKNDLFEMPAVFATIHKDTETPLEEMYRVFNMGHRLEAYVDGQYAAQLIEISKSFGIDAKVIGYVKEGSGNVCIETSGSTFKY